MHQLRVRHAPGARIVAFHAGPAFRGGFKPRGRLVANDGRAVIEAALQGFGIVLMADILVGEHLATGRLVRVLPGFEGPSRPMHLLTPTGTAQAPKLKLPKMRS